MPITLLYHDVTPVGEDDISGFAGPTAARYKLPPDEFIRHLDGLAAVTKQPPLATVEFAQIQRAKTAWLITFDDGGSSCASVIADALEQRNWRGWFFIATDYIDRPGFCSREQIADLDRRGHIIGSHSCSHPERISSLTWNQLLDEWSRSRQILSELLGHNIESASVPGGFYSTSVRQAARAAGLRILFNSEPTTSISNIDDGLVLGRYNVDREMPAEDAVRLLTSPIRRWRQTTFWNLKKLAKNYAGPVYKIVRQRVLSRTYSPPTAG